MNVIVRTLFGSRLYGTATADSDTDYKGIFMPSHREVLLGRIPKSNHTTTNTGTAKNTAYDVEEEIYSLHYFVKLACEGQTVALDMLHAPPEATFNLHPFLGKIWEELVANRKKFYTKSMKSFVGYARRQAGKYSIKGDRLAAARKVLEHFRDTPPGYKLSDIWDRLPEGDHIHKMELEGRPELAYQVCGRQMLSTAKIEHYLPMLDELVNRYGKRAQMAEKSEGKDWKAISHAIRAATQVRDIYLEGDFELPLRDAEFITAVKVGDVGLATALSHLDSLMLQVEGLSEASALPEKADHKYWDNWLERVMREYMVFGHILSEEERETLQKTKERCKTWAGD